MEAFINHPISHLLRYRLLMESVLEETPSDHEDRTTIPQILEVIEALSKETEPGVASAEQKVKIWRYHSNLMFKRSDHVVSFLSFCAVTAA
jgi:RHO1 GDP-GTP exchange protein 1/2